MADVQKSNDKESLWIGIIFVYEQHTFSVSAYFRVDMNLQLKFEDTF